MADAIFMMRGLEWVEPATKDAFHDKPMFLDVAITISIGMLWQTQPDIASGREEPTIARLFFARPSCITIPSTASEGMHPAVSLFSLPPIATLGGT
jgi:hypothetical protein